MEPPKGLKVLFFDVFGTCVAQMGPVADELSNAAQEALKSGTSQISSEVRAAAEKMTYNDWFALGNEWNKEDMKFVAHQKENSGNVDWKAIDKHRIELLPKLLAKRGLVVLGKDEINVEEGSLLNESQLEHLGKVWHRLAPWPDTNKGMEFLNKKYSTVALSNTYYDLMKGLVAYNKIPFKLVYTADLFDSYKPNPKVYLGAAEKMGVKPEECALVAAHIFDLQGAKACGFSTMYVQRVHEEKHPWLEKEFTPDMRVKDSEEGFIALAERLGIQNS